MGVGTRVYDQRISDIKGTGIHAFQKQYGWGGLAGRGADLMRKRCIAKPLLTQKLASQPGEGPIIANLANLRNAFGKPVCVKNA